LLQKRARSHPKIRFLLETVVAEILGDDMVEAVRLQHVPSGKVSEHPTAGVFIFIGHHPNTELFTGQLTLDERGYIVVDKHMHTNIPGIFAAGEVADSRYRQVITSAGMGAAAAMEARRFLEDAAGPRPPAA
jgi:thioredoxin reductase (NADPH)